MFYVIDRQLRRFFSIFYRVIIAGLCLVVYFTQNNQLPSLFYIGILIIYIVLYLFLRIEKYDSPFLRLVTDYFVITLFLYGKPVTFYLNYFLVMLPVINSPNNSSENIGVDKVVRRYFIYPCTIISLIILSYPSIRLGIFIPFLICILIVQFIRFRAIIDDVNNSLFDIVEDFYVRSRVNRDRGTVYNQMIQKLSTSHYFKLLYIDTITAFGKRFDELSLIDSSEPIISYDIKTPKSFFVKIKKKRANLLVNYPVVLNGRVIQNNFFVRSTAEKLSYYFLVTTSRKVGLISSEILAPIIFPMIFKHLAQAIDVDAKENSQRSRFIKRIEEKQEYVLKATEVMHFVKGSLSPIKSSLTVANMINDSQYAPKRDYLIEQQKKLVPQALREIKNIIDRADLILQKSRNPFVVSEVSVHTLYYLVSETRKKWNMNYSDKTIHIIANSANLSTVLCRYDPEYLDIVYTDLISNIKKYSEGLPLLNIIEMDSENFVTVQLVNTIKNTIVDIGELQKMIIAYNTEQKWEINKRKSDGMTHVKMYLNQMHIPSTISIDNDKYIFEFKIPKVKENENSNL